MLLGETVVSGCMSFGARKVGQNQTPWLGWLRDRVHRVGGGLLSTARPSSAEPSVAAVVETARMEVQETSQREQREVQNDEVTFELEETTMTSEVITESRPSANIETPKADRPTAYETLRQRNLEQNLKELRNQGFSLTFTRQTVREEKKTKSVSKKQKTPRPEYVRRSTRQRSKVEFYLNEDYSKEGLYERRAKRIQQTRNLTLSLSVLDRTLIDKLAAGSYVRTKKLATIEANKISSSESKSRSSKSDREDQINRKRKRRELKKIEKAVNLYSLTWMPKGARCKL